MANARATFATLIPPDRAGRYFALWSITDKSSSFLGPLAVGWLVQATGDVRYAFVPVATLVRGGRGDVSDRASWPSPSHHFVPCKCAWPGTHLDRWHRNIRISDVNLTNPARGCGRRRPGGGGEDARAAQFGIWRGCAI